MSHFLENQIKYPKISVLILGSYLPKNLAHLYELKAYLKEKGFKNTKLANDLVNNSNGNQSILSEIKELMFKTDFNIFVLFSNRNDPSYNGENESTIVELDLLIHSDYYSEKKKKF